MNKFHSKTDLRFLKTPLITEPVPTRTSSFGASAKKKKPQIKVNLSGARALAGRNCKLTQIMTKIMFYYLQWLRAMVRLLDASPDSVARGVEPNNVRIDRMTMCLLLNHFI
jgi:hypothetical protein